MPRRLQSPQQVVPDDADGEELGEDGALDAEDRIHGLNGDIGMRQLKFRSPSSEEDLHSGA